MFMSHGKTFPSLVNLVLSYQTVPRLPGEPANRGIFLPNGLLPVNWFSLTGVYIPAIFDRKELHWIPTRNRDFNEFAHFREKYLSYYADCVLVPLAVAQVYPNPELAVLAA